MKKNDTALNMLIPNALYLDAKGAAERLNISMASLVRMALTEYLKDKAQGEANGRDEIDELFASLPAAHVGRW